MAAPVFTLEILTASRKVFVGEVASLVAPGEIGYLGVLANHAPLMTTLVPGQVTWRDAAGATRTLRLAGRGILEVQKNQACLLADELSE